MNPITFASRRRVTILVSQVSVASACFRVLRRQVFDHAVPPWSVDPPVQTKKVETIPAVHLRVVHVRQPCEGGGTAQMEGGMNIDWEYHLPHISNIHLSKGGMLRHGTDGTFVSSPKRHGARHGGNDSRRESFPGNHAAVIGLERLDPLFIPARSLAQLNDGSRIADEMSGAS